MRFNEYIRRQAFSDEIYWMIWQEYLAFCKEEEE